MYVLGHSAVIISASILLRRSFTKEYLVRCVASIAPRSLTLFELINAECLTGRLPCWGASWPLSNHDHLARCHGYPRASKHGICRSFACRIRSTYTVVLPFRNSASRHFQQNKISVSRIANRITVPLSMQFRYTSKILDLKSLLRMGNAGQVVLLSSR